MFLAGLGAYPDRGSAGPSDATGSLTLSVQIKYEIYAARVTVNPFSPVPSDDGARDATAIRFRLPWPPASGSVQIHDAKATLVRTLSFEGHCRRDAVPEDTDWYSVDWDGEDAQGNPLEAEGPYACLIYAIGGANNPAEATVQIDVDRVAPEVSHFQVAQRDDNHHLSWDQTENGTVWLRIYDDAGGIVREWTLDVEAGSHTQKWDGRDWQNASVAPGRYRAKIFMRDEALNPSRTHTQSWQNRG